MSVVLMVNEKFREHVPAWQVRGKRKGERSLEKERVWGLGTKREKDGGREGRKERKGERGRVVRVRECNARKSVLVRTFL